MVKLLDSLNPAQVQAVTHKDGPIQIISVPGSGKTRVITYRIAHLINEYGISPETILAVTFTKKAAGEMANRLEGLISDDALTDLNLGTFHSICLKILRNEMDWYDPKMRGFDLVESWLPIRLVTDAMKEIVGVATFNPADVIRLISRAKNELYMPEALAASDGLPFSLEGLPLAKLCAIYSGYEKAKRKLRKLDFDDLLLEVYRMFKANDSIRQAYTSILDYYLIDEFQDTNGAQFEILRQLCDKDDGNIMVVGDDDQCHPPGVRIRLADGNEKRVEELSRDDYVRPWNRNAQKSTGKRKIQVASRPYHGSLFTMIVGKKSVPMTPNHRLLVRWANRRSKVCVTYLMWRANFGFRVGWCQLFNSEGVFHLGQRSRMEKADRVWILKVHASRTDASIHESIIAAKYGIPTITFEPPNGTRHYTKDSIRKVFAALSPHGENYQHGVSVLVDHNHYFQYPFYPFPHAHTGGNIRGTYFEVFACNLIPELMLVPLPDGQNTWQDIDAIHISEYKGPVYSLDVEKDHTYSANDVVVLNSVYSWRGAVPAYTINFTAYFPTATVIRMETNYRSCPEIIAVANNLISNNEDRLAKVAVADRSTPGHVLSTQVLDEGHEAAFICEKILERRAGGGEGSTAVLYRTNAQSRALEDRMVSLGIPYTVVGSLGFYGRKEIRDILSYLRLVEYDEDDAFRRVYNVPSRYLGKVFLREVEQMAGKSGCSLLKAATNATTSQFSKSYMKRNAAKLSDTIWALRDRRLGTSPNDMVRVTREWTGYDDYVSSSEVEESPDNSRIANLDELQSVAARFETLKKFLIFTETMQKTGVSNEDNKGCVELLTLHRAKGLEWNTVFIAGVSQRLLPHHLAESLEEERRLMYVGITRAEEWLYLCSLKSYQGRALEESQFLAEALQEEVDHA